MAGRETSAVVAAAVVILACGGGARVPAGPGRPSPSSSSPDAGGPVACAEWYLRFDRDSRKQEDRGFYQAGPRCEGRAEVGGDARLRGAIVDCDTRAPVAGLKVTAWTGQTATTDEAGRFELDGLPRGVVQLRVEFGDAFSVVCEDLGAAPARDVVIAVDTTKR